MHLVLPTLALMVRPTVQIAQVTAGLLSGELDKQYVSAGQRGADVQLGVQDLIGLTSAKLVDTACGVRN